MDTRERWLDDPDALAASTEITPMGWGRHLKVGREGAQSRHLATILHREMKGMHSMSLTTLTLEVRNDFDDPVKHDAMREAMRIAARELIATAT